MFEKLVDYFITNWDEYFDECPFKADDIFTIYLIKPITYEGYYTSHNINSSFVYNVTSREKLLELLDNVDDYIEVSLIFILKDGRYQYMYLCSHPQEWDVVDLGIFKLDLLYNINSK